MSEISNLAKRILRGLQEFSLGLTTDDTEALVDYYLNTVKLMAYSEGFRDGIKQSEIGDKK